MRRLGNRGFGFLISLCCSLTAHANPLGPAVVNGQVSFASPDAHTLNITSSPASIINWQQFSIQGAEVTRFIQESASSAVLNRVIGQDPSSILGQLLSNGRVFLINPNGIVFGENAVIDTAALIASTLNQTDADFIAGNLKFQGENAGSIRNLGVIKADGNIFLIAPGIENSGIIETEGGEILLAAGKSVTIASLDSDHIVFDVQAPEDEVVNLGKLFTHGGAARMFAGTIRHSGEINADSISVDAHAQVQLVAQSDIHVESNATITANGAQGGEVRIESDTGTTWVSGTVATRGISSAGGEVQILGERVALLETARVDVSGETGGGEVLIGGDYQGKNPEVKNAEQTFAGKDTLIDANAVTSGDGGKVIIWADESTQFYGTISARGGSQGGSGGFVEVSGKDRLAFSGRVDTSAPKGTAGTLLLDPTDILICSTCTPANANLTGDNIWAFGEDPGAQNLLSTDLATLLGTGNVTLQASNNITLDATADVNYTGAADRTLILEANNSILLNTGAQIRSTGPNKLHVTLNSDADTSGAGAVTLGSGGGPLFAVVDTNGGNLLIGGGAGASGFAVAEGPNPYGIYLNRATLSSGAGSITLRGLGPASRGISMQTGSSSSIQSTTGAISVTGIGNGDPGIRVSVGQSITSTGGSITLTGSTSGTVRGIEMWGLVSTTGTGTITMTGTGGTGGAGGSAHGIEIINGGVVQSVNGAITLTGTGGADTSSNIGVRIAGGPIQITSVDGNITITGTGGGTPGFSFNYGIELNGTSIQTTGTGSVTLNGQGGTTATNSAGIYSTGSTVSTASGALSITGTGGGDGAGVNIFTTSFVTSGSAPVTISGTGTGGIGIQGLALISGTIGGPSSTGSVTLRAQGTPGADSILLSSPLVIQGGGQLFLEPINASTTIGLGGAAGDFNLNATELGLILNGFSQIIIGRTDGTGQLQFTGPHTFNDSVLLRNGAGSILLDGPLTVSGGDLTLTGAGTISLQPGAAITANLITLAGGTVLGTGMITGNVTNTGATFAPGASPGTLTINGNYVQGPGGTLDIELGGPAQGVTYDFLDITGTATLAGTLNVLLFGGFTPVIGDVFDVIGYSSASGNFATVNPPTGFTISGGDSGGFYRLTIGNPPTPPPVVLPPSPPPVVLSPSPPPVNKDTFDIATDELLILFILQDQFVAQSSIEPGEEDEEKRELVCR